MSGKTRPVHQGELVEYRTERGGWLNARALAMAGELVRIDPTFSGVPILVRKEDLRPIYDDPWTTTRGEPLWEDGPGP